MIRPSAIAILAAALAVALAPLPLSAEAHATAVVFTLAVLCWVTEAVPLAVTSLLVPAGLVALGATSPSDAFAGFGEPLLFIFVGGFFIAEAMKRHGLDRRIAHAIVGIRVVAGRPTRALLAFGLAGVGLSMWMSNTATAAILVPIFLGCCRRPGHDPSVDGPQPGVGAGTLAIAYAVSVGGMGTLVGTPPNGITVALLEGQLGPGSFGFFEWMLIGVPVAVVLALVVIAYLARFVPAGARFEPVDEAPSGPMSRGAKVTLGVFALALLGWTLPTALELMGLPIAEVLGARLQVGAVALLATGPLFLLRDEEGEAVLPWSQGSQIDWGIIMLFAGGISLGDAMLSTGLAEVLSGLVLHGTGVEGLWTLTALLLFVAVVFTEVCSNTAAASILAPLAIAAAVELGVSPIPPALAVGLGASCGFMLPVATGPNAIAYGSGEIKAHEMLRHGFVLDVLCALVIYILLRVLCPLFGWA